MLLDNIDNLIQEMLPISGILIGAKEAAMGAYHAAVPHATAVGTSLLDAGKNVYSGASSAASTIASHAPSATQINSAISHPLTKKIVGGALAGGGLYMAGKGLLAHKAAAAGTTAVTKMINRLD